jgi:hypothetical protein
MMHPRKLHSEDLGFKHIDQNPNIMPVPDRIDANALRMLAATATQLDCAPLWRNPLRQLRM